MMVSIHNPTSNYMFHLHLASQKKPSGSNQDDCQSIKTATISKKQINPSLKLNYSNIRKSIMDQTRSSSSQYPISNQVDQNHSCLEEHVGRGPHLRVKFTTDILTTVVPLALDATHILLVHLNQMMQALPSFIESSPYNHIQPFL